MEEFQLAAVLLFFVVLSSTIEAIDRQAKKENEESIERLKELEQEGCYHDWTYHPTTKKLTCTKCNYTAGS